MPEQVFEPLICLWNQCLSESRLPEGWAEARTLFIDTLRWKTSALGRLLTSTSLRKLAPWIQAWAHTDLCGGLPEDRRADTLHARLSRDLAVGEPGFRNAVLGSKQGLAKCFDNTCHVQAISILAKLGLPCKLVKILFPFYRKHNPSRRAHRKEVYKAQ